MDIGTGHGFETALAREAQGRHDGLGGFKDPVTTVDWTVIRVIPGPAEVWPRPRRSACRRR